MRAGPSSHAALRGWGAHCSFVSPGAAIFTTSLLGRRKSGARQMEGPIGTQYKILIGWMLSFCPGSTIAIPKQCRDHGLFCLARHLGRAISLPVWSAATYSSPPQTQPCHGLVWSWEKGSCWDGGCLPLGWGESQSLKWRTLRAEAQLSTARAWQNPAGPGCTSLIML